MDKSNPMYSELCVSSGAMGLVDVGNALSLVVGGSINVVDTLDLEEVLVLVLLVL